jgi:hypothetical protein
MVKTCQQMSTKIHREHTAYRKALVEGAKWEPFAMMDLENVAMGVYGRE